MRPIVDGLQAEFRDQIVFVSSNAGTEGAQAFNALSLPGHPSFVIFDVDGKELYRTFGIVEAERLRTVMIGTTPD